MEFNYTLQYFMEKYKRWYQNHSGIVAYKFWCPIRYFMKIDCVRFGNLKAPKWGDCRSKEECILHSKEDHDFNRLIMLHRIKIDHGKPVERYYKLYLAFKKVIAKQKKKIRHLRIRRVQCG